MITEFTTELKDLETEYAIIGHLILNQELFKNLSMLQPEHFANSFNQTVFSAMLYFFEQGFTPSHEIFIQELVNFCFDKFDKGELKLNDKDKLWFSDELLANITGYIDYCIKSAAKLQSLERSSYYLIDLAAKRKIEALLEEKSEILKEQKPAAAIAAQLIGALEKISPVTNNTIKDMETLCFLGLGVVENAWEGKKSGIPIGFPALEKLLGSWQKSDLIVLAGRPGMGKTALALNLALNAACNANVLFFSLEMSAEQISSRIIAQKANVNLNQILRGKIGKIEYDFIKKWHKDDAKMYNLWVDDSPYLNLVSLKMKARKMAAEGKLDMVFVDYLQILCCDKGRKFENRYTEITHITRELKNLAREINVPIIALSQLSRNVEGRDSKMPSLADLRDSGSIEQDADIVLLMYREWYYWQSLEPAKDSPDWESWNTKRKEMESTCQIIIAKHRNGPLGSARLYFDGKRAAFANMYAENEEDVMKYTKNAQTAKKVYLRQKKSE